MISWSDIPHTSSSDIFLILSATLFCWALIGDTRTGTRGQLTGTRVRVVGRSSESESLPNETSSKTSPGDWEWRSSDACSCFCIGKIQGAGAGAGADCSACAWAVVDLEVRAGATGSGFTVWGWFFGCLEPPFAPGAWGMVHKDGGRQRDSEISNPFRASVRVTN